MKRIGIPFLSVLLLLLLVLVLTPSSNPAFKTPRFVPGVPKTIGSYRGVEYNWNTVAPFQDGKVWLWTVGNRTNVHEFLYDVDRQQILGELFHAGVAFCNPDQTRLLCGTADSPTASARARLGRLLAKLSFGKIQISTNVESYWILDLRDNSARRVGEFLQAPGTGSSWRPSPTCRYGYNVPTTVNDGEEFFLCDLEKGTFNKLQLKGDLQGWWSDEEILVQGPSKSFFLFNVATHKSTTLLTAEAVAKFFKEAGIDVNSTGLNAINVWNGREYDFYFRGGDQNMKLYSTSSFLVKLQHNGPTLTMADPAFEYHWLGRLDPAGSLYLYGGESGSPGSGGNGGVYLRDLTNHTTHTLVEPAAPGAGYSLPRFYRNSVIYSRNKQYRRIDLNGSNNVPAFPLPNL